MSQYHFHEDGEKICGRTFQGGYGARMIHPDGRPFYTFRTYTVLADGGGISFRDCCFENSAGPGETAGQAIALYLDGDGITLTDCVLRGHQDTLFLAPLPLKPFLKNGFVGPKEFTPRTDRTVYFKHCLIEGGIDFIFGGATAYFDDCEFRNVEPGYLQRKGCRTDPAISAGPGGTTQRCAWKTVTSENTSTPPAGMTGTNRNLTAQSLLQRPALTDPVSCRRPGRTM